MADPWNDDTPTNANTVKDVVPDEFQALKTVNINRLSLICRGLTGFTWTTSLVSLVWVTSNPLFFPEIRLQSDIGDYDAATGVFEAIASGYYRVEALIPTLYDGYTAQALILQRFESGSWVTHTRFDKSATGELSTALSAIIELATGQEMRFLSYAEFATNEGDTVASVTTGAQMSVEYTGPA